MFGVVDSLRTRGDGLGEISEVLELELGDLEVEDLEGDEGGLELDSLSEKDIEEMRDIVNSKISEKIGTSIPQEK